MSNFATLTRQAILSVSQYPTIRQTAIRHGMKLGASRFVAGETRESAQEAVAELNGQGIMATLDHLGEFVADLSEARAATQVCLNVLDDIQARGANCNLSLKLTQLGLDVDSGLCRQNLREIVARAATYGNFVRIDMEDSTRTALTLALFRDVLAEFGPERVGTALQGYLFRSTADLADLAPLGANLRLIKGAYMEPPTVAFPEKNDVDANYLQLVERHLASGCYTAVATHDESIIVAAQLYAADHKIPRDRFEFQMLYGIRRDLQKQLATAGYRVRVYVPFGTDWYGYFTRRLAERPANVMFVLSNLFKA